MHGRKAQAAQRLGVRLQEGRCAREAAVQTFETEEEGDAFAAKLEPLLDRGIVPPEYRPTTRVQTLAELVREYERAAHPSQKDSDALRAALVARGSTVLAAINIRWVDV